jgi:malonyl-CoA/methylmalonyl-CoA synthetase
MNGNLLTLLRQRKDADATALIAGWDAPISYGALFAASARTAHRLRDLGVRPGDRIAVQVEKSGEALILYLASLRVGGVYLPLNSGYTAAELDYFLGDAEPRLFVVDPAFAEAAARLERGSKRSAQPARARC